MNPSSSPAAAPSAVPVSAPARGARLVDLDVAKGVGIFLVVLGHIVAREIPPGNAWFGFVYRTIYKFHMPFFMFITGFLVYHTYQPVRSWLDYRVYAGRKIVRFIPAYLLFAVLILAGKLVAAPYLHVDNRPTGFWPGLAAIVVHPATSSASSLWYVYAVLVYCLVLPGLLRLTRQQLFPWLGVGLGVAFLPTTDLLGIDKIMEYAFVFLLGAWISTCYGAYGKFIDRQRRLLVMLFLVAAAAMLAVNVPKLLLGLLSIPALHSLCRTSPFLHSRLLLLLGRYTFAIYLMNTIAIGLTKGALLHVISWDGQHFLIIAPLLVLSGLFLPIVVKTQLLRRLPPLDRITH